MAAKRFLNELSQLTMVVVNSVILTIGLVLLSTGFIVQFASQLLNTQLEPLFEAISNELEESDLLSVSGNYEKIISGVAIGFIVTGFMLVLIGIFGCCGACCQSKFMLIIYAAVLGLIMIAEFVFAILIFTTRKDIDSKLKQPMRKNIRDHYRGAVKDDLTSVGWNIIMVTFKCCGVDNYTEFWEAKNWRRTVKIDSQSYIREIPITCCKNHHNKGDADVCTVYPTEENSYYSQGCYQVIVDHLTEHTSMMLGVAVSVVIFELLLMVISCFLYKVSSKKDPDK